jgi:hypothetical protein
MLGFGAGKKVSDEHNAPGISGGLQTRSKAGGSRDGIAEVAAYPCSVAAGTTKSVLRSDQRKNEL